MRTDQQPTSGQARPAKLSRRARKAIDQLADKELNFDHTVAPVAEDGWHFDAHCQALPPEPPGDPVEGATFDIACGVLARYEFADPKIVRAVHFPDRPEQDRDMLLEARFYGLTFLLGLRMGGVRDETVQVEGRPVRLWGWNYRTLAGHLEMGQMDYEVRKWLDTGDVDFRITAFSKAGRIDNLIIRLGFAVFGRWMQKRFARSALSRMRRLVEIRLIERATGAPMPREFVPQGGVRGDAPSRATEDPREDTADVRGTPPAEQQRAAG